MALEANWLVAVRQTAAGPGWQHHARAMEARCCIFALFAGWAGCYS